MVEEALRCRRQCRVKVLFQCEHVCACACACACGESTGRGRGCERLRPARAARPPLLVPLWGYRRRRMGSDLAMRKTSWSTLQRYTSSAVPSLVAAAGTTSVGTATLGVRAGGSGDRGGGACSITAAY